MPNWSGPTHGSTRSPSFWLPAFVLSADLQDHKKLPRRDERVRVGAYLGRLILNLQTSHVSPHSHVVFDDDFETVDSLQRGIEPTRWKWLAEHRREFHLDENNSIIGNSRIWTETELESSVLFEVPQESDPPDPTSTPTTATTSSSPSETQVAPVVTVAPIATSPSPSETQAAPIVTVAPITLPFLH